MELDQLYKAIQTILKEKRSYFGPIDGTWNASIANAYMGWCNARNVPNTIARIQPTSIELVEKELAAEIRALTKGDSKVSIQPHKVVAPSNAVETTEPDVVETKAETETDAAESGDSNSESNEGGAENKVAEAATFVVTNEAKVESKPIPKQNPSRHRR